MHTVLSIRTNSVFWQGGFGTIPFDHNNIVVPEPYQAGEPASFDHHERGHNRTIWFNRSPTPEV